MNTNKHSSSTSSFKSAVKLLLSIVLILSLVISFFNHIMPQYMMSYNASVLDKVERLESIEGPKIVLLGHSNLTFGINSALIEEALGMPVVNLGLHGGNGNAFHEEMAKFNVSEGDIYVLCHSTYDDDDTISDGMNVWSTIENHFHLWRLLRFSDLKTMAKNFPVYLKKCLNLYITESGNMDVEGVYSRSAFNEYGDIDLGRAGNVYTFDSPVDVPGVGQVAVDRINELNDYLESRGATLVVAGYPIGNGCNTPSPEVYIDFQNQLKEALDCPVISNYADYMFDYRYFFDTKLHLISLGANVRTKQLISDLKHWMETGKEPEMDEYTDIVSDVMLSHMTDFSNYISALNEAKERYTILISSYNTSTEFLTDELLRQLEDLGVCFDDAETNGSNFVYVIENGVTTVNMQAFDEIVYEGLIDNGSMECSIKCIADQEDSAVTLHYKEFAKNNPGLSVVVFSNESHRVLDGVTFDFTTAGIPCIR